MKLKLTIIYFLAALFISSCSQPPTHVGNTSPPLSESEPEDLTNNPQQALVIGNSEYEYSPLIHPMNDAKKMASTLKQMGFGVTVKTNLTAQTMKAVIDEFRQRLLDTQAQVGLFYFSGHGTQSEGQTFLLPINNSTIKAENDLQHNAVHAETILTNMETANQNLNVIILDAFYKNPYRGSSDKHLSDEGVQTSLPRSSVIAFGAAPNQFALTTRDGYHGLYTTHLLKVLANAKHQRIEDVLMEVHQLVKESSQKQQEPWYQASFRKPFCFGGCL